MLGCDGMNALMEAMDFECRSTSSNQQQYDLLSGVQGYLQESTITYTPLHVKVHKDTWVQIEDLDRMEHFNVKCDLWAKIHWHKQFDSRWYYSYMITQGMWSLAVYRTCICNHLVQDLWEIIKGVRSQSN